MESKLVNTDWYYNSIDGDNAVVSEDRGFIFEAPDEETGRLVCKCVNNYDELVKAYKKMIDEYESSIKLTFEAVEISYSPNSFVKKNKELLAKFLP